MAPPKKVQVSRVEVVFQSYSGTAGPDAERAVANAPFELKIGGKVVASGNTPATGSIVAYVPKGGKATLKVFDTEFDLVPVAALEPVSKLKGQQRRLSNLGYELGGVDGVMGLKTGTATLQFQADNALDTDGTLGAPTRQGLVAQHGE